MKHIGNVIWVVSSFKELFRLQIEEEEKLVYKYQVRQDFPIFELNEFEDEVQYYLLVGNPEKLKDVLAHLIEDCKKIIDDWNIHFSKVEKIWMPPEKRKKAYSYELIYLHFTTNRRLFIAGPEFIKRGGDEKWNTFFYNRRPAEFAQTIIETLSKIGLIGDITTLKDKLPHRIAVLVNKYKSLAGIEPEKTAREWKNERGAKGYQAYYTTHIKGKNYKAPTIAELNRVIEILEDFPSAQKIAINEKEKIESL